MNQKSLFTAFSTYPHLQNLKTKIQALNYVKTEMLSK